MQETFFWQGKIDVYIDKVSIFRNKCEQLTSNIKRSYNVYKKMGIESGGDRISGVLFKLRRLRIMVQIDYCNTQFANIQYSHWIFSVFRNINSLSKYRTVAPISISSVHITHRQKLSRSYSVNNNLRNKICH